MLFHAPSRSPASHLWGVWGYLRFGVAICAIFFVVGGLVSQAQKGFWEAIGACATGIALLLIMVSVAALNSRIGASSRPALTKDIWASLFFSKQSEKYTISPVRILRNSIYSGPGVSRVWHWTKTARVKRLVKESAVIAVVSQILINMIPIWHLISSLFTQ